MKLLIFKGEKSNFPLYKLSSNNDVDAWLEHTLDETHKDMQQWLRDPSKDLNEGLRGIHFEPRTSVFKYILASYKNPIYELVPEMERYRKQLYGYLIEFNNVYINKVGGFMFSYDHFEEPLLSIIDIESVPTEQNFLFNPTAKYLVLENDYTIDDSTIHYFRTIGEDYSYVVNLREEIQNKKIKNHLKEFYEYTSDGIIFVYTIGGDQEQLDNMFEMLVKQLNVPEIHISIPNSENYENLVVQAAQMGTTIKFINVY